MIIAATIVFQVIIVEFLGTFADTIPLSWELWVLSIGIGALSLGVAVVLKCIPLHNFMSTNHHHGYQALPSGPELT